ncbi:hypothetical protein D3C75_362800 [compost metagenome]
MKTDKAALVLACMAVVIGIGSTSGPVKEMLAQLKPQDALAVKAALAAEYSSKDLRAQVEQKAAELNVPPVDAAVDRVWKAIPGYNGLEVDVEATYRNSLQKVPGEGLKLVYRQTKPKISLNDLGANPIYRGNPAKPMVAFMM